MRIVVTGSSGYIGAAVVARLQAGGHSVVGIDRRPSPGTTVVGDLVTLDLLPLLGGVAAVVHGAALHAPHVGHHGDDAFVAANVVATERLVRASAHAGIRRFVFLSTTSVYGRALDAAEAAVWVDETLVPEPRDIYDATKLDAEAVVTSHAGPALATATLRIGRCFVEPWRTTVVNRMHRGVDRRDVVDAIERALTAPISVPLLVNVAGPRLFERTDLRRLRTEPVAVIDQRAPGVTDAFRRRGWELPTAFDRVYVSDRAVAALGYQPRYGVQDALATDPAR